MNCEKKQLREAIIRGALFGGFFGIVAAFSCLSDTKVVPEFCFSYGALCQGLLQLGSGMLAGITIGAMSFAITVPQWKSEPGSVMQLFIAPTAFMYAVCAGIYFAWDSPSVFLNEIVLAPLAAFSIFWTFAWSCLSVLAMLLVWAVRRMD